MDVIGIAVVWFCLFWQSSRHIGLLLIILKRCFWNMNVNTFQESLRDNMHWYYTQKYKAKKPINLFQYCFSNIHVCEDTFHLLF